MAHESVLAEGPRLYGSRECVGRGQREVCRLTHRQQQSDKLPQLADVRVCSTIVRGYIEQFPVGLQKSQH